MSLRLQLMVLTVIGLNVLAFAALLATRRFGAALFALGLVAYGLGMRHAFDADHIAAIDNVTRRLRQLGRRPVAVGFSFSLGHSTVVVLLVLALALAFGRLAPELQALTRWGTLVSNAVSALMLTLIGLANLAILHGLIRKGAPLAAGGPLPGRGWLGKSLGPIDGSAKMFPVGMLFGLGFDTATEVALLAISAGAVQSGHFPLWAVMSLPLLFAAGMCAMDSVQSLIMLRIYDWAVSDGNRSLRLNTVVTGISVLLALGIAGLRWSDLANLPLLRKLLGIHMDITGSSWLGLLVSATLVAFWLFALWRRHRRVPEK